MLSSAPSFSKELSPNPGGLRFTFAFNYGGKNRSQLRIECKQTFKRNASIATKVILNSE